MDGTYSVECEGGPGGRRETFPGLDWKAAEARCEAERVKLWAAVY